MEVDKDDKLDTLRENLISHTRNSSSVASSVYQQRVLAGGHFGQQNDYNSHPISTQDGFYWDESDRSDKGEDADDSNFISTVKPTSHSLSAPEIGSASSKHRYGGGPPVMLSGRSDNWMSEKLVLVPGAHRTSSDSGYGSKTSSMQPIGFEYSSPLRNSTSLRSNVNLESNSRQWAFQRFQLHAISCPESHQNIELNCCNYCSYCGTSCLQELALSVFEMTHLQVYDYLSTYMVWQGVRHYDFAGNTFLHKLAAVGAPWEYIEAGLKANIDPCHRNAYGQTFVHVLNISNFQNNLIQCLASLRGRGVDFSLRDASGRTILHCLYGQPMSPHTARQILNLIDESGRQLSLRDVTGRTPWEVLQNTCHQQASVNPRWSIAELQLQMLGIFEDIANSGVLRLESELAGWPKVVDDQKDLQTILQNQYEEVIKNAKNGIVVEAFDGSNAFHAEASPMIIHETMEDLSNLKKFIEVGIDVNQYDSEGRTPLEAIITQPRECETELTKSEKVSLLIDKGGAKVYFRNRLGHTPLYSAAIRGLDRTVESLLLRGSHPNIIANDGQSLLRAVDDAEQEAFMEYLESGRCQYHEAQCSRIEECKMLLKRYGAVLDPTPAQAMGYPPGSP
jgi:ankyrin repeat protein